MNVEKVSQKQLSNAYKKTQDLKNYYYRWKPLRRNSSPIRRRNIGDELRGRKRNNTIREAPAAAPTATAAQATNPKNPPENTTFRITHCAIKVNLFDPPKPKNRRMTPWELQEEKEIAGIFRRPMRYFLHDKPIYPFFPPEPMVNFDLNYKQ